MKSTISFLGKNGGVCGADEADEVDEADDADEAVNNDCDTGDSDADDDNMALDVGGGGGPCGGSCSAILVGALRYKDWCASRS